MRLSSRRTVPPLAIAVLVLATAAIHWSRAVVDPEIRVLFILNGLGYLALLAALYLPLPTFSAWRRLTRRVLMGYTTLTIMLFFVWSVMSGNWSGLGLLDKAIEVVLFILLWLQDRWETSA